MMENIVIEADSKETKAIFEKLAEKMGLKFRNLDRKFLQEMEDMALGAAMLETKDDDLVSEEEVRKVLQK